MRVELVVPIKRFSVAKTRLAELPDRAAFAMALALDTVAAALGATDHVVAVTDEPEAQERLSALGAKALSDAPNAGLNAALAHGASAVVNDAWVGALSGDLPALRTTELRQVLTEATAGYRRSYVADRHGSGTTLLLAPPGTDLQPDFGPGSAKRHAASGAVAIGEHELSLRTDVDTWADLREAETLGLGPRTSQLLSEWGLRG